MPLKYRIDIDNSFATPYVILEVDKKGKLQPRHRARSHAEALVLLAEIVSVPMDFDENGDPFP